MSDDDLYFSFGDDEVEDEEDDDIKDEESGNRGFLIGAGLLGAIFIIGICVVVYLVVIKGGQEATPEPSPNELTNQANMTLYAATQTASAETQAAPVVVEEPTDEPVTVAPAPTEQIIASPTPESGLDVTTVPEEGTPSADTGEGTPVAEVTSVPEDDGQGGGGTEDGTPTPLVQATESGIIEVTPIGGGEDPTSTPLGSPTEAPSSGIIGGDSGSSGVVGGDGETAPPVATGSGGPITVTAVATLPNTGFGGTVGLAGAGILAFTLVAVVFVARRMRLK